MLIFFFSFEANSISLLLSSIKFILKFSKLFSVNVINGKQRCLLLFISLLLIQCNINPQKSCFNFVPIINFFRSVIPNSPYILLFIRDFLMLFSFPQVINFCSVSFFIDGGNRIPNGVNLQAEFLCFF